MNLKTVHPISDMEKQPTKLYKEFKALLPWDGFCVLNPDDFKKMMKIIHNKSDKRKKRLYFEIIMHKLFASGWGWYMRLGESLSSMRKYEHAWQMPKSKQEDALAVLRMVKDMHIELHYSPSHMTIINHFIRDFGGKVLTPEQKSQQNAAKFNKAVTALRTGQKMPRKMKKAIKTQLGIQK